MDFQTADEAWDSFKKQYLGDYAGGFPDNPLEGDDNLQIYMKNVSQQANLVTYLESVNIVREVKRSEVTAMTLSAVNRLITLISAGVILVLLGVSIFLISNTVTIGIEIRRNEIEIMKFRVLGEFYGINVAKVKEIMMTEKIKPMPHSHPSVEGFFKPRQQLITVINLANYLTGVTPEQGVRDLFIITHFNKMMVAFRVDSIEGISRISWQSIQKPDRTLANGAESVATGIAQCDDQLVTILDFEKIVAEISPETSIKMEEIEQMGERDITTAPIVIAEDSVLLQKMIGAALQKAGFTNVSIFNNGQEAWDYLSSLRNDQNLYQKVNLLITDIEMPMMDGHRLTKLVKDDMRLKRIPVVIFSSLINDQMRIKGKELGADEQLTKPEIGHLVEVLDTLIKRFRESDHALLVK